MIYGYIDESKKFDKKFADWASDYSKQVHNDYEAYRKYLEGEN